MNSSLISLVVQSTLHLMIPVSPIHYTYIKTLNRIRLHRIFPHHSEKDLAYSFLICAYFLFASLTIHAADARRMSYLLKTTRARGAFRASRLPSQEVVVVNTIDDTVGYVGPGDWDLCHCEIDPRYLLYVSCLFICCVYYMYFKCNVM